MTPLLDQVHRVKREMARQCWQPVSITMGWLTFDFLAEDLKEVMPYSHPSGEHDKGQILGFEVQRSQEFPVGTIAQFQRQSWISPTQKHVESMDIPL